MTDLTPDFPNVTVYPPDEYSDKFTVTGDLRAPGTGYDDEANYDARDALESTFSTVEFDPESACFYAYTKSERLAVTLAETLEAWITERRSLKVAR